MATFNSQTFNERGQSGALVPVHGAAGVVSVRPRASSTGSPAIDFSGTTVYQLQMPISCGSAALSGLRSSVGASDSLVYAGGTVTAALVEVGDGQKVVDSTDLYFGQLTFLVASANTTITTPALGVTVAGNTVTSTALSAVVSHGIDQNSGQAQVVFDALPTGGTEGGSVLVSMGGGVVFDGTVTSRAYEHFPTGIALDARDRMEYLTYPYGGTERTYTSQTLGTVVQNLIEAQGINSANTSVEDSGWTVGVIQPVVFRQGDRFLPWIKDALSLAGYAIFTKGVNSAVFIRPLQYGVTNGASHTLTEGTNIISARRTITREGIYNAVQVDGYTYEGASVSVFLGTANSDVRDPPGTLSMYIQNNLIEDPARGTIVAQEMLSQHNFKPEAGQIVLPGTAIEPMDVLVVTHSDLGMSGATVAAVQVEQRFDGGGYVTTVNYRRIR